MNQSLSAGVGPGVWSETSAVPSLSFNTTLGELFITFALSGSYSFDYIVAGGFCPDDTSTMVINIVAQPDAGSNSVLSICSSDGLVDVNTLLSTNVGSGT